MSNAVTITLVMDLKPETAAGFCAGLPEMLKDTKKFPGFRNIRILKNKANANQIIFIEEWNSEEDYGKYIAWRTERGDMNAMGTLLAGPPKMEVWPELVAN
jgi:quinol monooxygenase YgiN